MPRCNEVLEKLRRRLREFAQKSSSTSSKKINRTRLELRTLEDRNAPGNLAALDNPLSEITGSGDPSTESTGSSPLIDSDNPLFDETDDGSTPTLPDSAPPTESTPVPVAETPSSVATSSLDDVDLQATFLQTVLFDPAGSVQPAASLPESNPSDGGGSPTSLVGSSTTSSQGQTPSETSVPPVASALNQESGSGSGSGSESGSASTLSSSTGDGGGSGSGSESGTGSGSESGSGGDGGVLLLAVGDSATVDHEGSVAINVLGNDLGPASINSFGSGAFGMVALEGNQLRYTAGMGETGIDQFSYTITDGQGNFSTATVEIEVASGGLVATDDVAQTNAGTAVAVAVLGNDLGHDGRVVSFADPSNGVVSLEGVEFEYTPNLGFHGIDRFSYTITDGQGQFRSATVDLTVIAPGGGGGGGGGGDGGGVGGGGGSGSTSGSNEGEGEGEGGGSTTGSGSGTGGGDTPESEGGGGTGSGSGSGSGSGGGSGSESGGGSGSTSSSGSESGSGEPWSLVAVDDYADVPYQSSIEIDVLGNDIGPASIDSFTQGSFGTVGMLGGQLTYTATSGAGVTDVFGYTITDGQGNYSSASVVVSIGEIGLVANDDWERTIKDSSVHIDVLSNDLGHDGRIVAFTDPLNGTVVDLGNRLGYSPDPNFVGIDSFVYTITDGYGNTESATVQIEVSGTMLLARDDRASTFEDTDVQIPVLANDAGSNGTVTITAHPVEGTVQVAGGQVTYTPGAEYAGEESFEYQITDANGNTDTATVTVNVRAFRAVHDLATTKEDKPVTVAVLTNDLGHNGMVSGTTEPTHGTVRVVGAKIEYTPNEGYIGPDSFTYKITNGQGLFATAAVDVTVDGEVFRALDDYATTTDGTMVFVDVLLNDRGYAGDVVMVGQAAFGDVDLVTGSVFYTPEAGFRGPDSFTYTIENADGDTKTARVHVYVDSDEAIAVADQAATVQEQLVTINVLANDFGYVGGVVTLTQPANGAAAIEGGQVVYLPVTGFAGIDSFTYTITDGTNFATAGVTVAVAAVPLDANDDGFVIAKNTSVAFDPLANDTGHDGTIVAGTNPDHGFVVISGTELIYTPDEDYVGLDEFSYTITDGDTEFATATVRIEVKSSVLKAEDDHAETEQDIPVTIAALANDDGYTGAYHTVDQPEFGTVTVEGNDLIYTPNSAFYGKDDFTYQIQDTDGNYATATVNVHVESPTFSIVTVEPFAVVDPYEEGKFEISRTGNLSRGAVIEFTVSGDAVEGEDYEQLARLVNFAPGLATASINVVPLPDPTSEEKSKVLRIDLIQGSQGVVLNGNASLMVLQKKPVVKIEKRLVIDINANGKVDGDVLLDTITPDGPEGLKKYLPGEEGGEAKIQGQALNAGNKFAPQEVRLQLEGYLDPTRKITSVEFEIAKTTKLPGFAGNAGSVLTESNPSGGENDFSFDKINDLLKVALTWDATGMLTVEPAGIKVWSGTSTDPKLKLDNPSAVSIPLFVKDFGGVASIKATVKGKLVDGNTDFSDTLNIQIPIDANDNGIADFWENEEFEKWKSKNNLKDKFADKKGTGVIDPRGDKYARRYLGQSESLWDGKASFKNLEVLGPFKQGDGLTAFYKYRGIYADGGGYASDGKSKLDGATQKFVRLTLAQQTLLVNADITPSLYNNTIIAPAKIRTVLEDLSKAYAAEGTGVDIQVYYLIRPINSAFKPAKFNSVPKIKNGDIDLTGNDDFFKNMRTCIFNNWREPIQIGNKYPFLTPFRQLTFLTTPSEILTTKLPAPVEAIAPMGFSSVIPLELKLQFGSVVFVKTALDAKYSRLDPAIEDYVRNVLKPKNPGTVVKDYQSIISPTRLITAVAVHELAHQISLDFGHYSDADGDGVPDKIGDFKTVQFNYARDPKVLRDLGYFYQDYWAGDPANNQDVVIRFGQKWAKSANGNNEGFLAQYDLSWESNIGQKNLKNADITLQNIFKKIRDGEK